MQRSAPTDDRLVSPPPLPPVGLHLADLPEAEVIARAAGHDAAASTELLWRCYPRVLAMLSDRLGDGKRANDMLPEVMDLMLRALPSKPARSDFYIWLAHFVGATSLDL